MPELRRHSPQPVFIAWGGFSCILNLPRTEQSRRINSAALPVHHMSGKQVNFIGFLVFQGWGGYFESVEHLSAPAGTETGFMEASFTGTAPKRELNLRSTSQNCMF